MAASVLRYAFRPPRGLDDWLFLNWAECQWTVAVADSLVVTSTEVGIFEARSLWRAARASISAASNQNGPGTPRKNIIDRARGLFGNPKRWPSSCTEARYCSSSERTIFGLNATQP